ncbi:MAG TPA: cbb3-type cytochrome c oxidase subunit I [Candidatus Kapabacteria bacterium]|nr:cbb3-type cytochrome c oxidase subunit I [Candidatus Kapabacteria bacterium]
MTAPTTEAKPERTAANVAAYPPPQEIDYSCRNPLLFLVTASVLWLIVSLLFAVLAAVKMHAPGMFADVAALTYGRVAAISSSTLLYGFLSQAGIAIALWLFARNGHTFLVLPNASILGGLLWNIGVAMGVIGIFRGGMNHFPAYEMPYWTTPIFFVAFLILGLSGLLTFVARSDKELYPSTWFLFAAFFVFPWIMTVAYLLLGRYDVRGVFEPIIATWFANQFVMLWLAPIALAVIFYLMPKLSGQPLYSRPLAIFSFWFYLLAATASGFQNFWALPAWMPTLSATASALLAIPVLAILFNWYKTWAGHNKAKKAKDVSSKYLVFSAVAFFVVALFAALLACPAIDVVVGMTLFVQGSALWTLYAFIGMAFFAAIYHIVPRLIEIDWPSPKFAGIHFALSVAGIVMVTLALLLGGISQGTGINNSSIPFVDVSRGVVKFIGINTLGLLLLLGAQFFLLANLLRMMKASCVACCGIGSKEVAR